MRPTPWQRELLAAVQEGFPLTPRPFQEVAQRLGVSEAQVIEGLRALREGGVIKRAGVVVRHLELGYRTNAMVVWDVSDEQAACVGQAIAEFEFVTLCYRRKRVAPRWPYNLYCMIHGRDREEVLQRLALLTARCGLESLPREVLFSRRRFKQRGAWYAAPVADAPPADALAPILEHAA
ncbi:MAG: AsnC family protein [Magnetococcales bacterium]|nr:AsnC family protein [Magnetococcales bacterium]